MQFFPMVGHADRHRRDAVAAARRKLASASPLLAATLLTAAAFLLPAPGTQEALASAAEIPVSNHPAALH